MKKLIDPKKVKIVIGPHLAKSYISINGKNLPCTYLKIELGSNIVIPKITLETESIFITEDIKVELDQNSLVELHIKKSP